MLETNPLLAPQPDDPESLYENFLREHPHPWCWACGRGEEFRYRPIWWHAPWMIQRHHIVRRPRRKDRRAVIALCPICHELAHGGSFPTIPHPPLALAQQIWLKRLHDLKYYDPEFLARNHVGRLPEPLDLPTFFSVDYCTYRGPC